MNSVSKKQHGLEWSPIWHKRWCSLEGLQVHPVDAFEEGMLFDG